MRIREEVCVAHEWWKGKGEKLRTFVRARMFASLLQRRASSHCDIASPVQVECHNLQRRQLSRTQLFHLTHFMYAVELPPDWACLPIEEGLVWV